MISPEIRKELPLGIQQIISDQETTVDLKESTCEKEIKSLSGTRKKKKNIRDHPPIFYIEKLVHFMETSISAELSIGKTTELLKMVSS